MKRILLLIIIIFGYLTNYAQIYKVTFHKPDICHQALLFDGKWSKKKDSFYKYTINDNDTYSYEVDKPLSETSDEVLYIPEEPKTLHFYSKQHFTRWLGKWGELWRGPTGKSDWTKEFSNGSVNGIGLAYDNGYYIYDCDIKVSYEKLECNCDYFDNLLCQDQTLSFTNSFEVPFYAKIYVAKKNQSSQLYDLHINLNKNETSFNVNVNDLSKFIDQYYDAFYIYIKFSILPEGKIPITTYKIPFKGIKSPVPYEKPYIKDINLLYQIQKVLTNTVILHS